MYLKAEQNKYMCFYNNNHIHCKITISWFTAYMYLFAFLHDINNNTSIDSYLFDFTYCVPRSFSLLSCIGFMFCSYQWSRGVTILQLQVSIQQLISRVVWGQTYNIGPCCNYFVDLYENNYILCWSILRLFC